MEKKVYQMNALKKGVKPGKKKPSVHKPLKPMKKMSPSGKVVPEIRSEMGKPMNSYRV